MSLPIYIYCTKAKPWLCYDEQQKKYALRYGKRKDTDLNGTVCFKCECKEAFSLSPTYKDYSFGYDHYDFEDNAFIEKNWKRMALGKDEADTTTALSEYGKRNPCNPLYALHLEKVDRTYPMGIAEFYKDEACTEPLTKAPQSYCHAYRWVLLNDDDVIDNSDECDGQLVGSITDALGNKAFYDERFGYYRVEQCLIYSIRPEWLCKIANGEKDLEVRKSCPKEIEVK